MNTRIERDSMGELAIPADTLYGVQTQRAVNNFPISGQRMPMPFIRALLLVKAAAAKANAELGLLEPSVADAIVKAATHLFDDDQLMQHFPVDVFQTGSGTSSNMNANEVLANLASKNSKQTISANDHVNFGQSSNDTIPSCMHIGAVLLLEKELLPALRHLEKTIYDKAATVDHHIKTGRTHLMDAMPVRLSQSLLAWADQINANIIHLEQAQQVLQKLPQGGTAVGTGVNTHENFAVLFNQHLSALTEVNFSPAANFFSHISAQDGIVALSGQLKTLAVSLMKIANDLRWMNSGPLSGLGEIALEALQPGSSIMPGKVNPVLPEAAAMVAAQVIGNDAAITMGGQSGNFELNVMLPMMANNVLSSLQLLSNTAPLLADKAIKSFIVNEEALQHALSHNPILVTALNPIIGYAKAAEIAKKAYLEKRPIIDVAMELTGMNHKDLTELLDVKKLTFGGL